MFFFPAVKVWLEYVQYSIGGMSEDGGLASVRDTFERALTAVGIHVAMGSMLWEAYREFESAMLAGLQPTPGSVADAEAVKQIDTQMKRIAKLFQRQLSVPLVGQFHISCVHFSVFDAWLTEKPTTHYSAKSKSSVLYQLWQSAHG